MRKFLKFILIIFLIICIIFGIIFGILLNSLDKINRTTLDGNLYISKQAKKLTNYENIALFAVDSRDLNTNNSSRSDGIIILSINKFNNELNMVSIYRDTYVQIPGHGFDKITHAFAYGRSELAIETINLNFDLNISKYITVNFVSVAKIIDELGEIQVEINDEELAELNRYIPDTMEHTQMKSNLLASSGVKSLDGVQAVTYARIRKITGGDYGRNTRMRTVILKAFEKFMSSNITTKLNTLNIALENIQTNMSNMQILTLLARAPFIKIKSNQSIPYTFSEMTLNAFYEIPKTLQSNVIKLHEELFMQKNYEPSDNVIDISNQIIIKTGVK